MPTPFIVGMCNYDGSETSKDGAMAGKTWLDRVAVLERALGWFMPAPADDKSLYCFIAPEFFFGSKAQGKDTWNMMKNQLGRFGTASNFLLIGGSMVSGTDTSIPWKKGDFYNRVPVWYGGQFMQYQKHEAGGETQYDKYKHYKKGTKDGTFDMTMNGAKHRFGLEVCMDHDTGTLQKGGADIDVQLITANTVTFKDTNIVADQYALLCNPGNDRNLRGNGSSCLVRDCKGKTDIAYAAHQNFRVFRWDLQLA